MPEADHLSPPTDDPLAFLSELSARRAKSGVPPPIPDEAEVGAASGQPRSGADVLAGYRRRSKPAGEQIRERLTRGVDAVRKRTLALKLQHEVNSLQTAVDGQFEILGTLALTHRPSVVDVGAEIAELSQIQEELARKETTIESLRQTTGGGSAVKELKQESAQLRDRQQAVMIAIGRKASTARPEMPGAAGPYTALDRLQSSLDAKHAELKGVEDEIGPLWDVKRGRFGALKKPAMIFGVAAAGLILVYLLWSLLAATLFAAGLPKWTRYHVPNDTKAVAYVNVEKLRKTTVFKKFSELFESMPKLYRQRSLVRFDETKEAFSAFENVCTSVDVLSVAGRSAASRVLPRNRKRCQVD